MSRFTLAVKNGFSKAFNLSILEKDRMAWVDYLRGIAIILVVYRHVLIGLQRSDLQVPTALVTANMIFFSFRMPLFFILSGIFVSGSIGRRPLKQLLYIKFENLLYPYLIWCFLQVALQVIFSRYTNAGRTLIDFTYILYQPRSLDQFWYLPALFNTTVIYILIKAKLKPPYWAQLLLGVLLYMLSPYCQRISMISDWMEFYIFFALGDSISTLFFHEKTQRFLQNPWTLLAVIPVFTATQLYYLRNEPVSQPEFLAIALIGCFSMFVLAFRMQAWKVFPFLRVLGFHSLFIYVMHVIIAAFVRLFLTRVLGLHNATLLLFFGIAFGVTIPVIFYNLCIKDKPLWFLFTLKKPVKKQASAGQQPTAA
jgi:fucose 4-O-acetylase-like acetyltransferase